MSNKTKTNFISASVKKVLSLSLLVTGGVVMSSMALALLLQDTASSNNENVQVWGIQSRVQYLTGMTLSWANSDRIKFEYKEDTNALNFNGAMNLHALVIGSTNQGATGSTVIGGNNNIVKWNWQNAAIIGGNKNTVTNTTTSIIAGATGSNITNVQDSAIFSAEGTIIGSDNTTDTMFIVWGKGHVARGRNTNFIAGSENIKTDQNAQNNVLIGKNIRSNQSNIFVWSNGNTELTPQKGSAFYVNSTSGFGLNTNNPQAALDIANGGLAFNKVYQLSEISDVNVAGVHTVVQKDGKQGVCGYNGSTWVPLTLNAEREGLCTASTQSTPPKHATSTISGAVQFSGQPVITNGTTLLHQVWSGGMNNNHGGWLTHPWIYKHTGPLDNGAYRCGIGFHMGNPTPDGMKNTDCKACSPITNQRDWRSNGKNDDCEFSCKAGFKKVGRTCTTCEVGTYTTDGTLANSCASCTNKPANAHYTTNGINANACQWACDAGYHNVGWACKKAIWQKTDTYTCNVAGGIWKDDKIVTTYHCALEENRGVSVPEHICSHWWVKPNSTEVKKWDENCNPPQWETTWDCPNPSCNTSRIAGKCGGVTESVTCTQYKKDRAGNIHERRTQSQQKACTRACETAACGAANGVATKYQPTALCAAGTASAVGGNASVWSWTCTQLDGAKNCSATRIPLQAGVCGSAHNIMHMSLAAGSANLCGYGSVIGFNENAALYSNRWSWKCRGDNWAHNQEVNCIAHKPVPQAGRCAQAANTCTVGTIKDPVPIPNGRKWSCQGLYGGTTDTNCSLCDPGYHNMGWVCKKAVWQWTDAYTCNTASGKWKDDNVVTTYHCALEENRAIAAPEHICNHWRAKPATTTVVKWEASCNTPQWETNWNCPTPNCNISRIAGKCGGVTEGVTCTQHKKDRAGTIHETRTQVQQKACTRACETAACGSANGVATKYQPTALCAAGTASAVGGNPSIWSWTCAQLDGAKSCSATKIPLQAGSCGSSHNINHNALNAGSANLCNYGSVISFNENGALYTNRWSWKCRGDSGAHNQDANCIAHKPAPQAGRCAQALNTCMVGTVNDQRNIANGKRWSCQGLHGGSTDTTCSLCDNWYIYDSVSDSCKPKCGAGYTLHNGICVKWKCETTPASSTPWRCEGSYSEGGKCYFIDYGKTKTEPSEFTLDVEDNCLYASTEDLCRSVIRFRRNDESIEQRRWSAGGHYRLVKWFQTPFDEHSGWDPICNYYGFYHDAPVWANCKGTVIQEPFCYWWPNTEQKSCSSLNQTECGSKSWCYRRNWTTTPGTTQKICIDDQWNTRPDSFCANTEAKSCVVPVNGQCKIYSWVYISQPATSTANGCVAGEFEDIADDGLHKWKCKGKSWGIDETCSARKRPAPSPLTCPTGFVLNNGKCVQWACHNRTKPGAHWCIGSAPSSECKKITQESLCENSYEMREICTSIGLPCIGIGPEIFITKERAATFPNWSPVGIGYDPSKWVIGEYYGANWYLGYGWSLKNPAYAAKVGPCQWWEKEEIVVCKNASGTILPDQNCISPKPEEDDVCDPIVPPSSTVPPRPPVPPKKPPVPPLNGQCKTYAWSHTSQPATSKVTGCLAGDYEDIPDDSAWKWRCKGKNGGLVAYCSAAKQLAPSGCTPWTTQKCWYDSGEDPCHFTQTCRPDRTRGPCRNPHSWNHDMTCNYRWESVYCGPAAVVDETTRDTCECFDWKTFQWALPWYPWNKDAGWELVRRLNLWNGKSDPCE